MTGKVYKSISIKSRNYVNNKKKQKQKGVRSGNHPSNPNTRQAETGEFGDRG